MTQFQIYSAASPTVHTILIQHAIYFTEFREQCGLSQNEDNGRADSISWEKKAMYLY